ncbi:MAG: hypothetical protein IPI12_02395 [Ignavibacteriales bacterium]|nr:hypothetical protein [Ignavibacteriales bacterium]MBK8661713.1 hypothetical protein [Ignavibacteriales bacterium]MBP7542355.1 hypothetical protein [Ignavibacteriaceae bacterium]MBP9122181.1 hypothetical protein [Ignavibacteriaceae bacterium]MCC6638709.1 hypothetical protein [Ignavibacteriaceae bacterium]
MKQLRSQRQTSRFILLLYLVVLGISSFHFHESDLSLFGIESVSERSGASNTHHSTTGYSACIMVVFANTSSVAVNKFQLDPTETILESIEFERNVFRSQQHINIPLLRGPPSLSI